VTPIKTNEACMNIQTARQAALANCKVRLFQDTLGSLTNATTKAEMVAAEATYTGYLAKTVVALLAPYVVPGGGANVQIPTQQFQPTGSAVTNMIRGWWVELATGDIQVSARFDADIPMASVNDAIPLDIIFNEGNAA